MTIARRDFAKSMETKKTILVVEDEKSLIGAIIDTLHLKNFLTLSAKNGKEGVELALLKHPDLILLDLLMPEMDGMTAFKKIREDAWGANVPVIILTNLNASNDSLVKDVFKTSPAFYLIKADYKLADIVKKIEELLKI